MVQAIHPVALTQVCMVGYSSVLSTGVAELQDELSAVPKSFMGRKLRFLEETGVLEVSPFMREF
jgi:hypothetical protein